MRSFGSLYQHPPRALRTSDERAIFGRALGVMADLCARDRPLRIFADVSQTFCLLRATTRIDALRFATFVDASAIGTTVLQIKEIPARPSEFDGAICLFELVEDVEERDVRQQLKKFGSIMRQRGRLRSSIVGLGVLSPRSKGARRRATTSRW